MKHTKLKKHEEQRKHEKDKKLHGELRDIMEELKLLKAEIAEIRTLVTK